MEIEIKDQPCEMFGMESIFERVWRGTMKGCYERYLFGQNEVLTYDQWNRQSHDDERCDTIYPIAPMS